MPGNHTFDAVLDHQRTAPSNGIHPSEVVRKNRQLLSVKELAWHLNRHANSLARGIGRCTTWATDGAILRFLPKERERDPNEN